MRTLLGALLGLAWMTGAAAQERLQIQFAEPVELTAAEGSTYFEAYGRRFDLSLQSNDRLLKALPGAHKAQLRLRTPLRGKLQDAPGSWVRLARVGNGLEGAIWDGRELYVVTAYQSIAGNLSLPLSVPASQTVIYRLSDALQGLPANFCGVSPATPELFRSNKGDQTGLDRYQQVVSELRANSALAAPTDQIEIALVADTAFQALYGADSSDAMLARLNTVDGIFAEQVGLIIVPTHLRLVPSTSDPFTSTNAQTLLGQLADYREAQAEIRGPGLAHLMSGKDLDGDTVGIAFIDALCDQREGVSLSENTWGSFLSALIMAHELGHNFGARHDGVPGSACESTPQFYLMAPQLNSSTQFSQCSLDAMAPVIARARSVCVGTANYADVGVQLPASPFNVDTSSTFTLPVTVTSVGNATAADVQLEVDLPSQLAYESAVVTDGSCVATGMSGQTTVSCTLGDMAAAEQRVVELRLTGNVLGSFHAQARLSSANDYLVGNNTAGVQIGLQSAVDLGLTLTAPPGPFYVGDVVEITLDVSSLRSQTAVGGTLALQFGGIPIETIEAGAHACTIEQFNSSNMNCQLADVPSGTTTRITVRGRPVWANFSYVSASVNVTNDGDFGNNHRSAEVQVRPNRQVITTASTENLQAVIGVEYDVTYTLTAAGRFPSTAVSFFLDAPWYGEVLAVTPSSGTCSQPLPQTQTRCDFGDLDPGEIVTVAVRVRMQSVGSSLLNGRTVYMDGTLEAYSYAHVWITSALRVDAMAEVGIPFTPSEGQSGGGSLGFHSIGIDPAQNVVVTLDVPVPVRLTHIMLGYAPAGWSCEILTPQQGRCIGSFDSSAGGSWGRADYFFVSDVPVDTQITVSLTADSDGNTANDTATTRLQVLPLVDVSVTATTPSLSFTLGESRSIEGRVRTGHNPVSGVWLLPTLTNPLIELEAVTVDGNDCTLTEDSSPTYFGTGCQLGDLPANADLPISLRYRALEPFRTGQIELRMAATRDSDFNNNVAFVNYETLALTDVLLSVASGSINSVNGTRVRYPLITVANGSANAVNVRVDISLPAFVSIESISSSGMCVGTSVLQCSWSNLAAGGVATIDLQLLGTGVGSFTSNVSLQADNDATAGNNAASVNLSFTAASSGGGSGSSSSGGGSKGGGGGLEWLTLGALAFLLRRRLALRNTEPCLFFRSPRIDWVSQITIVHHRYVSPLTSRNPLHVSRSRAVR